MKKLELKSIEQKFNSQIMGLLKDNEKKMNEKYKNQKVKYKDKLGNFDIFTITNIEVALSSTGVNILVYGQDDSGNIMSLKEIYF